MKEKYNHLFETLVEQQDEGTSDELIGMLAYAEYKIEKRAYLVDFHEEHNRLPNEEEIKKYLLVYNESKIEDLMNDAENTLVEFAQAYLKAQISHERSEIIENSITETVDRSLREFKRQVSWPKALGIGALSSLVASFFIVCIVAIISMANPTSYWSKIARALYDDSVEIQLVELKEKL